MGSEQRTTYRRYGLNSVLFGVSGPQVNLTTFDQSYGSELLVNSDLNGDPPTSWSVIETAPDPELTEVGSGELHGGAGTGAQNFFSSATGSRPLLTQGGVALSAQSWYMGTVVCSARDSGNLQLSNTGLFALTINEVGTSKMLAQKAAAGQSVNVLPSSIPADITTDSISILPVTLNTQQVGLADGTSEIYCTVTDADAGEEIRLLYRIQDVTNYWYARLYINPVFTTKTWSVQLRKVVSGTTTSFTSELLTTTPPDAFRVIHNGSVHTLETLSGETWTQRAVETDSDLADATGVNVVYTDKFTPTRLRVDFL